MNESIEWLNLPDVAEMLGEPLGRVNRLLDDRALLAVRRNGIRVIPADFIAGNRPLPSLRGTVILLGDTGLDDEEIITWLYTDEPELGHAPIKSLLLGRKSEVRRVAAALL